MNNPDATFSTQRVFNFPPARIYAAIQNPDQLAKWWGPNGFTNTITQFDFTNGGHWAIEMHGPDGTNYPNESTFSELVPDEKVVIQHDSQPVFTLTITMKAEGEGTLVTWDQEFETAEMAEKLRHICVPANEQNLDRMTAVLAGGTP